MDSRDELASAFAHIDSRLERVDQGEARAARDAAIAEARALLDAPGVVLVDWGESHFTRTGRTLPRIELRQATDSLPSLTLAS